MQNQRKFSWRSKKRSSPYFDVILGWFVGVDQKKLRFLSKEIYLFFYNIFFAGSSRNHSQVALYTFDVPVIALRDWGCR